MSDQQISPETPEVPGSEAAAPAQTKASADRRGLPLWMPLAGLSAAFVFMVVVGAQVCPTLAALLFPPEPPLPQASDVRQYREKESAGIGSDKWFFATDTLNACEVARFYEAQLGVCSYEPTVNCDPSKNTAPGVNFPIPVANCQGRQAIGAYSVRWLVEIGTNYSGNGLTRWTITRIVSE